MKNFLWILFVCATASSGIAQQLPKVYNQFFMNPYIYNSAYAGVEGHTVLFFTYKKQFAGIQGAPTLMHANFHVPLKGGLGVGALAFNESMGLYDQSGGKVSASYLVSIDREHFFRFGMSLGAGTNSMRFGEFDSPHDPAFANLTETKPFLLGDVGFTYHFGHFNIGVSLPSLFGYDLITQESDIPIRVRPHDYAMFKLNYRGHINDDIAIEPHILYRYNNYLPDQLEGTLIFHLFHVVWVGGSYRQDAGFAGLIGAKLLEKVGVGYSYEYGNPNTAGLLGPTHEIHIGYHLGTRKEHAEHVSSFIKSHRKSAEERAKEAELERQRRLQALRESRRPAQNTTQDENALTLVAEAKPPKEKPNTRWSYEKEADPIQRVNRFGETERGIKFDRLNEDGKKEVVFSWLPPPPPGATEESYEIANPEEEPLIRTRPDGTKEAGIKWRRTIDGGEPETLIIWDEILSEEEANMLDQNKSEAHALGDARIIIRREEQPVAEEPQVVSAPVKTIEEKPVVVEEPVREEPKPAEKPVVKELAEEKPAVVLPEEKPVEEEREKGDPELTNDFRSTEELAKSDEPLVARRGGHMLELPAGNYVVAGVFENFNNAENFSDRLFQRGFHASKVGYLSARGYYYVVILYSEELSQMISEKNRIKKQSGLENVWVLTVNE